jgi:hypothetical protein
VGHDVEEGRAGRAPFWEALTLIGLIALLMAHKYGRSFNRLVDESE